MNKRQFLAHLDQMIGQPDYAAMLWSSVDFAQSIILERGHDLPWFLLQTVSQQTVDDDDALTANIPYPTGFLRGDMNFGYWYNSASATRKVQLKKVPERIAAAYLLDSTGAPIYYTDGVSGITLYPTPDVEYTITSRAYIADDAFISLADDATNLWLTYAPDLLMAAAASHFMRNYISDPSEKKLALLESQRNAAYLRLLAEEAARTSSGTTFAMREFDI